MESAVVSQQSSRGLSQQQADELLAKYGPNLLPEPELPGLSRIFLNQFLSPFIYILLLAAIASFALNQLANAVFIFAVLLLNAVIGTVQEYSAQRAAAALRNMVKGEARVIRDGSTQTINVENLVPGDLVLLSSGDKIPADILLQESRDLTIDESLLTGESMAVAKDAGAKVSEDAALAQRSNYCFAGTIVTRGRARGLVMQTAMDTQIGRIARHVTQGELVRPPLMIRIQRFTYQVAAGIMFGILLLIGIMIVRGYDLQGMVMMAIGLAVSTIPEGLPAALTVALAIGMRRMAQHNVIIRKLVAVEALGSCTFICSDKTGTLTVNELTIRKVMLPDGQSYDVSGEGVSPGGSISGGDTGELEKLCVTGLLANESHLDYSGGEWASEGDIVDVAFLVLAKKLGLSLSGVRQRHSQLDVVPYESERAYSCSLNSSGDDSVLNVKGSPEKILAMSESMLWQGEEVPIDRALLTRQFESLAVSGYRIIALARRHNHPHDSIESPQAMTFLGMVAMIDPVRPEAREAIRRCHAGGIEVAMITGDHPATAKAISLELGLCQESDPVVSGDMIRQAESLGEKELDELILPARVFARIEPTQKEQIVDRLMRAGHFVAVTGDGVNDAPALKHAHAGVAMGKRGTDVARETADLIITDDNFASIVDGIEQGRIVYNNIRKVIALLIATGFSALLLFFCTALAGYPMPMVAVQLLWLNLIANGLRDVALAFEPGEGGELDRPPRSPQEPIFESHIIQHVLITGTVMGLLAFGVYAWLIESGEDISYARNLTLMLMVLFGNLHALSSRSETRSLFTIKFLSNPFLILAVPAAQLIHIAALYTPGLSSILELSPIRFLEWLVLAAIALLLLLIEELHKWYLRYKESNK